MQRKRTELLKNIVRTIIAITCIFAVVSVINIQRYEYDKKASEEAGIEFDGGDRIIGHIFMEDFPMRNSRFGVVQATAINTIDIMLLGLGLVLAILLTNFVWTQIKKLLV